MPNLKDMEPKNEALQKAKACCLFLLPGPPAVIPHATLQVTMTSTYHPKHHVWISPTSWCTLLLSSLSKPHPVPASWQFGQRNFLEGLIWKRKRYLRFLKLTVCPWKMDGWNTNFLLGFGLFSGAMLVLGRVPIFLITSFCDAALVVFQQKWNLSEKKNMWFKICCFFFVCVCPIFSTSLSHPF